MIENSQLQALLAIRQTQSYSKAAEKLGVTQSAISQIIRSLELKVGVELVSRNGKLMILTAEGQRLAQVAESHLADLEHVLNEVRDSKGELIGQLHLGTLYGIGKSWVASRAIEFSQYHQNISVKVSMDFPQELIKAFAMNEIDCMVLPENLVPDYAAKFPLHDEFAQLVYPIGHSAFDNLTRAQLKKMMKELPVILFEESDPLFLRWCKKINGEVPKKIHNKVVVNSFRHILEAVSLGLGVAVVPSHVLERSFYKDKVATLEGEYKILNNRFCFVVGHQNEESLKTKKMYEHLLSFAQEHKL
jgi:DNA-binding transcriptional LysR family regulator